MPPVQGTGPGTKKPDTDDEPYDYDAADAYLDVANEEAEKTAYGDDYGVGDTSADSGYTTPTGGGRPSAGKNLGVAGGGDLSGPGNGTEGLQDQINLWKQQGLTPYQIQKKLEGMGYSQQDAFYFANGGLMAYGEDGIPNQYQQSNQPYGGGGAKFLASWEMDGPNAGNKLMEQMMKNQELNEAKAAQRNAKKMAQESKVKIHMILLQIMMGDIVGALRSYAVLMDRDMRAFTRLIVKKLDAVRHARSQVIRNFARTKPPRAYAGQNPSQAARAQDRSSRYTQFVQMSTQLMNELQNTERELVDALQSMHRNMQTFWESYAGFRDQEFRTNERVMTMR
jgi:hypothetical protein